MLLLHASPYIIPEGEVLRTGERGYVCLASSVAQAKSWALELARGRQIPALYWIYEVEVLGNKTVEDCPGHYAFEYPGTVKTAVAVVPHQGDLDGEVVSYNPVKVLKRLDSYLVTEEVIEEEYKAFFVEEEKEWQEIQRRSSLRAPWLR